MSAQFSSICSMGNNIGTNRPPVQQQSSGDVLPPAFVDDLSQNKQMSDPASAFRDEFLARIKALREERGLTQADMATALGVLLDAYKKYEQRSLLPHNLIERFALIVGRDVNYVMTGKEDKRGGRQRRVS